MVQLVEYVDAYGTLENFDNSTYFLDVPVTRQDAKAVALAYKLGLVAMDDARLFGRTRKSLCRRLALC